MRRILLTTIMMGLVGVTRAWALSEQDCTTTITSRATRTVHVEQYTTSARIPSHSYGCRCCKPRTVTRIMSMPCQITLEPTARVSKYVFAETKLPEYLLGKYEKLIKQAEAGDTIKCDATKSCTMKCPFMGDGTTGLVHAHKCCGGAFLQAKDISSSRGKGTYMSSRASGETFGSESSLKSSEGTNDGIRYSDLQTSQNSK